MNKLPLYFLFTAMMVVGTGCEKPKTAFIEPVEADTIVREYSDVNLSADVSPNKKEVQVLIELENRSDEEIPLNTNEGNLFLVVLKNEKGEEVLRQTVKNSERNKLMPKEKALWEALLPIELYGSIAVDVELLLKDSKNVMYSLENTKVQETAYIEEPAKIEKKPFIPMEPLQYTYKTNSKKEPIKKEEFLFMETGYAQSRDKDHGVSVYELRKDGLYVLRADDPIGDINFIEEAKGIKTKELVLKMPAKVGEKWKKNKAEYKIVSVSEEVKTAFKTFEGAVKVEIREGKNLWYSYYHEDYGFIKMESVMKNSKNKKQSVRSELELKSVEKITEVEGRELSTDEIH